MGKTRGKGEGSVYPLCQRKGAGHDRGDHRRCDVKAWVAQVENGRYPSGRRKYARAMRPTKSEAQQAVRELQRQIDEFGVSPDRVRTVDAFLDHWHGQIEGTIKPETHDDYGNAIRLWIKPNLGAAKKVGKLRPSDVDAMDRALEAKGKAPDTRRIARAILRRALGWGVREGLLTRNVAALTDGPKGVKPRIDDALEPEEARAVLEVAEGDRLGALAVLALYTGPRKSEGLALSWPAVDFENKTFELGPTMKYRARHGLRIDDDGKREASIGTLPLIDPVETALRKHRRLQAEERLYAGELWTPLPLGRDLVFRREDGTALSPQQALNWWKRLCVNAGIGPRRFHAARHTTASLLHDEGVPMEDIRAILRHASLRTTETTYARISEDRKRRALVQISALGGR